MTNEGVTNICDERQIQFRELSGRVKGQEILYEKQFEKIDKQIERQKRSIKRLRVAIICVAVAVILIGIGTIAQAAEFETWYTGAANGLNLRAEPNTDCEVLTVYPIHTELSVIGTDGGEWWQVWDGTNQGWVNKQYMSPYADNGIFTYHGHSTEPICAVTVTQYDTSPAENGGYSTTACGDRLTDVVGLAIAADPNLLPMGSKVYIEGVGYRTVRDVGGAIKGAHIDNLVWQIDYSWDINAWHNVYAAW